jgi:hypothetical protein
MPLKPPGSFLSIVSSLLPFVLPSFFEFLTSCMSLCLSIYHFSEISTKPGLSKDDNLFSSLPRNTWKAFLPGSSRSPRGRTRVARRRCTCRTGAPTPHHTTIPSTLTISKPFILLFRTKLMPILIEYLLIGKNVDVKTPKNHIHTITATFKITELKSYLFLSIP